MEYRCWTTCDEYKQLRYIWIGIDRYAVRHLFSFTRVASFAGESLNARKAERVTIFIPSSYCSFAAIAVDRQQSTKARCILKKSCRRTVCQTPAGPLQDPREPGSSWNHLRPLHVARRDLPKPLSCINSIGYSSSPLAPWIVSGQTKNNQ